MGYTDHNLECREEVITTLSWVQGALKCVWVLSVGSVLMATFRKLHQKQQYPIYIFHNEGKDVGSRGLVWW